LAAVKDPGQVGVLDAGRTDNATAETAADFFVKLKGPGQALDYDLALEGVVVGQVDLGRVTNTNNFENPKPVSKNVARRK